MRLSEEFKNYLSEIRIVIDDNLPEQIMLGSNEDGMPCCIYNYATGHASKVSNYKRVATFAMPTKLYDQLLKQLEKEQGDEP